MTQTIPKKRTCKRAEWLCEEALEIAERREAKSNRKRETCTQLNAEMNKEREE